MNISSQGYLCNLLKKPLLHTAFHMSLSHSFSSQECVSNTSELVWRLTGWCSEMDLPAGAGIALNVRILWLLLLKRQKAISLPAIHRCCLLQTSHFWKTQGKVEEYVQICLEEPQVGTASCAELLLQWRAAHPMTSFIPKFHRGLNRQKQLWGDVEIRGEHYLSLGPKGSEWRLLLSDGSAWLMRDELSDVPYLRRERAWRGGGGARAAAVRRAALIRFYIWAQDNKTTI